MPEEQIVFINAWNEWGEGNHLEPDLKNGRSYLEATKRVLADSLDKVHASGATQAYTASIIIPVFNRLDYTRNCIQRLIKTTGQVDFEVVVIDNGSTDGTRDYLQGLSGDIKVITNCENVGYTIACNQGARAASGKYLVFLNNDTLPQSDWLQYLVDTAASDGTIGAVGSKLVYPDGTLQEAGAIVFRDGTALNFGRGDDPENPLYNQVCEVDYCSGACLLVPTSIFLRLGCFDERYAPAYYEETDFCFTLRKHGYRVVYQPRSCIIHYGSVTAGLDPNGLLRKYLLLNKHKFVEKWTNQLLQHRRAPVTESDFPCTADRNINCLCVN